MDQNPKILSWNPCGLNNPAKRDSVREVIDPLHVNVVCLQETKMDVIDRFIVNQCLGPAFDGFDYLPAEGTRGGILLAWNTSMVCITNVVRDSFAISGEVHTGSSEPWWITIVYSPQRTKDKIQFLAELTAHRNLCPGAWMIIGDFNMILRASEKSNDNLDRASMRRFRDFVSNLELK
jgi:exonuclease III